MRMRLIRAVGVLSVLAAAVRVAPGCSSFGEDAGSTASDASLPDGPAPDASLVDSSSVPDASVDVLDAGPDAPFCASTDASRCWSFDEGPPYLLGLGLQKSEINGGVVSLTQEYASSAPNAARLETKTAGAYAGVFWTVSGVDAMFCEANVVVDKAPNDSYATLAQLTTSTGVPIINAHAKDGFVDLELVLGGQALPLGAVALKQPGHLAFSIDRTVPLVSAQLGTFAKRQLTMPPTTPPTSFYVFIAIAGWSIVIDDLVCATR